MLATVIKEGEDGGVVGWAHVKVVGQEVYWISNLGLGLLPKGVGLHDDGVVVVLGVGGTNSTGLTVSKSHGGGRSIIALRGAFEALLHGMVQHNITCNNRNATKTHELAIESESTNIMDKMTKGKLVRHQG